MSEPLQATTLGEALVEMVPLSREFPRAEEAFTLTPGETPGAPGLQSIECQGREKR